MMRRTLEGFHIDWIESGFENATVSEKMAVVENVTSNDTCVFKQK